MLWQKRYEIGVQAIDKQHENIVDLVDVFVKQVIKNEAPFAKLNFILRTLKEYCVEHFATEEKFHEEVRYPAKSDHKEKHIGFLNQIENFEVKFSKTSKDTALLKEFAGFLTAWLLNHIFFEDQKLSYFLDNRVQKEIPKIDPETIAINSVKNIINQMTKFELEISKEKKIENQNFIGIKIKIINEISGELKFLIPQNFALVLSSKLIGFEVKKIDELSMAALTEIINIIAGKTSEGLVENGYNCDITTPEIIENVAVDYNDKAIKFHCDCGDFYLLANIDYVQEKIENELEVDIEKMKILSIDDNRNNLLMIETYARKMEVDISSFLDPIEAITILKKEKFDLVIVDYMMPKMDGMELIRKFREFDNSTPIVMLTAAGENSLLQLEALEAGATDFLTKPFSGVIFQARIRNLLSLKKSLNLISNKAELLNEEINLATRDIKEHELETLSILGKVSEYRDPETNEHILRVANYSRLIAKAYGLNEKMQNIIYNASPFHDIGKIGIPDKILLKPDRLDDEEWDIMKSHSTIGYDLLKNAKSPYLKTGGIIAYSHHERYDGNGYPQGLKGNMIPLYGRIVAIADVFDALCSRRPYKQAWKFRDAFQYVVEQSGKQFDPKCVEGLITCKEEIRKIHIKYKEE